MTDRSTREEREKRLRAGAEATQYAPDILGFQHSILCQTSLPYRNPGDDVRTWQRNNGGVGIRIEAGVGWSAKVGDFVPLGIPYGTKPRLLLCHLNAEALRYNSPDIDVDRTITGFVKAVGLAPIGRNIVAIRDQLTRLSASSIVFGFHDGSGDVTVRANAIHAFKTWDPTPDGERATSIRLSREYFEDMRKHAVPLHNRALMALSGNAMALDVYAWLAQRLHRISWGKPVFVPWSALKAQFGFNYDRMNNFKAVFRQTLRDVHSQYRAADLDLDGRGLTLRHSPPPVKGRTGIVTGVP